MGWSYPEMLQHPLLEVTERYSKLYLGKQPFIEKSQALVIGAINSLGTINMRDRPVGERPHIYGEIL